MSKLLLCSAIALNAFCAGGIFTFPLMSPVLASRMLLSQPQLTTIILGAMMSQYPFAIFIGSLIDRHGPAPSSLIAALLFAVGFGGFAFEITSTPEDIAHASQGSFYRLALYFLLAGLGTVFAYCSCVLSSSVFFPNHIGFASGSTMALFGLSPFICSVVATRFFMDSSNGTLKIVSFTTFLAVVTLLVYTYGFLVLRRYTWPIREIEEQDSPSTDCHDQVQETTPLLPSERTESQAAQSSEPSAFQALRKLDFWLLFVFCFLILGACEMVISNIGSIVLSLPPISVIRPIPNNLLTVASSNTAFQVQLISIVNTFTRFFVGPLADFISPVSIRDLTGVVSFPRKHFISRFAFLSSAALILALTFLWTSFLVQDQSQVWLLSLGTGLSYSTVFTVLPSLISSLWGIRHLGRNFGILMYAPFSGTPLFSYIYALVSVANTVNGEGSCQGRKCWSTTFAIGIATSSIALVFSFVLWKRWYSRI
ncbi:MFS general substrate transporter [Agrocybe pediades]|nr:MFS general substrate transporter [Agrocybe pediades]